MHEDDPEQNGKVIQHTGLQVSKLQQNRYQAVSKGMKIKATKKIKVTNTNFWDATQMPPLAIYTRHKTNCRINSDG